MLRLNYFHLLFFFYYLIIIKISAQNNFDNNFVTIEKVMIGSEVIGPFSKHNIEILFHNTSAKDSLEATCEFSTNSNSFIKELYLEMEEGFKRAETFSRRSGEKIYERVTGKNLDPALLRTNGDGFYTLRVFPFKANQFRRVKIDLYSMLAVESYLYEFKFKISPQSKIIVNLSNSFPDSTLHRLHNEEEYQLLKKNMKIETTSPLKIIFKPPKTAGWFLIQNEKDRYYWDTRLLNDYKGLEIDPSLEPYEIIEQLINFTKTNQVVDASHVYWKLNPFAQEFIKYLVSNYNLKIYYKSKHENGIWENIAGWWRYTTDKIIIDQYPHDENVIGKLVCPFLSYFSVFNALKGNTTKEQAEAGFLTPHTSKLVLEEDVRVQKIRDKIIYEEDISREKIRRPAVEEDKSDNIIEFFSLTEKPEIIYRAEILYPEIAAKAGIEGMVVVKVLIDTLGNVEKAEIVKSAHPVLDNSALFSASLFKFKPAMQRNKKVKMWMAIPFTFKSEEISEIPFFYKEVESNRTKRFQVFDKTFYLAKIDDTIALIEDSFKLEDAERIRYKSDDHFELLYRNPELFKYCYLFPNIALRNKEKFYLIR